MRCVVTIVAGALLTTLGVGQLQAKTVWNFTESFSDKNGNPNGVWTYGCVKGASFQAFTTTGKANGIFWRGKDDAPVIWRNDSGAAAVGSLPGQVCLHPGPGGEACVVRWTAPANAGSSFCVRVQGEFLPGDDGAMAVGVFVNGTPQVTRPCWGALDSGAFDLPLSVKAGDTIDFAVFGEYRAGSTPLQVTITTITELPPTKSADSMELIDDFTKDFSEKNGNPNGVWTYGYVSGSEFCPRMTGSADANGAFWLGKVGGDGTPAFWQNRGKTVAHGSIPGDVCLHPGPNGEACVARWTARADIGSSVHVQGKFSPGNAGIMNVGVFVNGTPQTTTPYWEALDAGTFDFSVPIVAGDTIDFAVYGGYNSGTTPLQATISYRREPSPFVLLGIGVVGLIIYALRQQGPK